MRRLVLLLAIASLVLSACAREEEAARPTSPSPGATPTSDGVNDHGTKSFTTEEFSTELELDDFYFEPTFIRAPGGSRATLELFNEGSATHTFTIDALEIDEELDPGARQTIQVNLGTETRYEFYCRFHSGQGMRGAFSLH
jgi:plastocyanin